MTTVLKYEKRHYDLTKFMLLSLHIKKTKKIMMKNLTIKYLHIKQNNVLGKLKLKK